MTPDRTPDRIHVFYTDKRSGWAVTAMTSEEYQVGAAEYLYHKSDALWVAKSHDLPVHIFGRNGLLQRIA